MPTTSGCGGPELSAVPAPHVLNAVILPVREQQCTQLRHMLVSIPAIATIENLSHARLVHDRHATLLNEPTCRIADQDIQCCSRRF